LGPRYRLPGFNVSYCQVSDTLVKGDWLKGPIGSNESAFLAPGIVPAENLWGGALAESWESIDPVTMVFHIRKGVHWQDKPPVNGREFTADDVVFNLERYYTLPTSYLLTASPGGMVPTSIEALDRYTVEVKCPDPDTARVMFDNMAFIPKMLPPEVIEKYGDMQDWRNVVGTGAFTVKDEVAGISTLMVRNPNYWETDPLHPDNQLPYLDQIQWVFIDDAATRLAALRTAKVDLQQNINLDEGDPVVEQCPDLVYSLAPYLVPLGLALRCDKPEKPWYDKRVRHALALAMDNEGIKRDYYGGRADIMGFPMVKLADTKDWFLDVEELPEETRELYEYHPDKAKQLLIEAGYPDGFDIEICCRDFMVDLLSMIKATWAEIGVNLIIDVRDSGAWTTARHGRTYEDAIYVWMTRATPVDASHVLVPGDVYNTPMVDDPTWNEYALKIPAAYSARDDAEVNKLFKELSAYTCDQQWVIQPPNYLRYMYLAWPWVKQYDFSYSLGVQEYFHTFRYAWLDQELKKELGH